MNEMTPPLPKLLDLYRSMLRIRLCEEAFVPRIVSGEIRCPVHLYSGEEAVAVGVCDVLRTDDAVFGTHRSHGLYLAKGGDLGRMVAEIFCKETGCAGGRGGSMHVIDTTVGMMGAAPIVAGTIALAVGAAYAAKVRGTNGVGVAFFGDGATGEGVLFEAMNLAAVRKLPALFVCENNLYSTHLPILEIRANDEIWKVGEPFGLWARRVDGNDVLAVREAAAEAVAHARTGLGPAFLECMTYRLRGHVGPDDNIQGSHVDIRPAAEVESWRARDPIPRLAALIQSTSSAGSNGIARVQTEVEMEVAEAFEAAHLAPFPNEQKMALHVFR
jgi:acetoin:2,6-dichlorophenolindophenol oxidoreductase subunit alpha